MAKWRDEIIRRGQGRRQFRIPGVGEVPKILPGLRGAPRGLAARFFQLASGHAMIAPFLKEKFGWVDSESCWWCSGGRQSREHLFKECRAWKEETRELWKKVDDLAGSCKGKDAGGVYKGRKGFCFAMEKRQVRPP